jgi:hypothetical protein
MIRERINRRQVRYLLFTPWFSPLMETGLLSLRCHAQHRAKPPAVNEDMPTERTARPCLIGAASTQHILAA